MATIDKNMYEALWNWWYGNRPKTQRLMYVNSNDTILTKSTIRKIMLDISDYDKECDLWVDIYSGKNFYKNMRDYYTHIVKACLHKPGKDEPILDIIDYFSCGSCGWATLIVEDIESVADNPNEMQEMMASLYRFASKRANIIMIGKGEYKDVCSGCEYTGDGIILPYMSNDEGGTLEIGFYNQEIEAVKETITYDSIEKNRDDLDYYWWVVNDQLKNNYFDYQYFKHLFRDTLEFIVPRVSKEYIYRNDLDLIQSMEYIFKDEYKTIDGCCLWELESARKFVKGLNSAIINRYGYNDDFSFGKLNIELYIEERDVNHGCIHISGGCSNYVKLNPENVFEEMDEAAEVILECTYNGDSTKLYKWLFKKDKEENKKIEEADIDELCNKLGALNERIKEAADNTVNKDRGKKVRRNKNRSDNNSD